LTCYGTHSKLSRMYSASWPPVGGGWGRMTAEHARVVAAAAAGDRSAFDTIVQQYQARIARYILRLVNDEELALDLTQDTFVNAFRNIHNLRSDLALSAWLYRIATNLAVHARWRNRRIHWQPLANLENTTWAAADAPDNMVMDRELVRQALDHLPRDRAACLLLHVKEGFSYEEVAVIMGSTPEAVRKRIARAKDQFRAFYDAACKESVRHAMR
jgi:RNA polymerase sigma-70 factor (ECF subfamily)